MLKLADTTRIQPLKAPSTIVLTLSGITTLLIFSFPQNASYPMCLTGTRLICAGIIISVDEPMKPVMVIASSSSEYVNSLAAVVPGILS